MNGAVEEFSAEWYLASYPDVAAAGVDPLSHYLHYGRAEGRLPNGDAEALALLRGLYGVDARWYRARYPDVDAKGDAALHYHLTGWREGKNPSARFSTAWYLARYPDVAASGMDPLLHYLQFGRTEGRSPAPGLLDIVRAEEWWSCKFSWYLAVAYATAAMLHASLVSLWPTLLLFVVAIAPGAAFVAVINDFTDRDADAAAGKVNRLRDTSGVATAAMLAAPVLCGVLVASLWLRDPSVLLPYAGSWLAYVLYSAPPFRFKARGVLGVLADVCGSHLFPTMLMLTLVYRAEHAPIAPLWFGAVIVVSACFGIRGHLSHQVADRDNDDRSAVRTFAQRHDAATVQRLVRTVIFPIEFAALAYVLYALADPLVDGALVLYVLVELWRAGVLRVPTVLSLLDVRNELSAIHVTLYPFYELYFPLALLLSACARNGWDVLVAGAHVLLFARVPLRREAALVFETLMRRYYPALPTFRRSPL